MSAATNPSAAQQARRAQADAIEELKQQIEKLDRVVDQLKVGLDEATKNNKTLRKKVSGLQSDHDKLVDQFEDALNEQKNLRRFKARATKLLLALAAGHSVEEIQSQVLAAAVSSGDPSAYLAVLVEDGSNGSEDEEDAMENAEGQAENAGQEAVFGGGGGGAGSLTQEQILGSSPLKASQC
jgi:predicted RNase H-like nuclease (RuvC/YqgF family)